MAAAVASPQRLTVLYDAGCAVCQRSQRWLARQPAFVPLELVAAESDEALARYGPIGSLGSDLVVVGDDGTVWVGPAAFIMCLWALREWREWSYRLSSPSLAPLAKRFFLNVSSHRQALSTALVGLGLARSPDPCIDETCAPATPSPR